MELTLADVDEDLVAVVGKVAAALQPPTPPEAAADDAVGLSMLAELGVLAIGTPTERGGDGGSWLQATLVVETLAERASPAPILGSVLTAALLAAGHAPVDTVRAISDGRLRLALGLTPDLSRVARVDDPSGGALGFDAAGAEGVLVLGGGDAPRVHRVPRGGRCDGVDVTRVLASAPLTGGEAVGDPLADDALRLWKARAWTAVAADAFGVMQSAVRDAVAHACEREQFGVPIGSFQAIQHLLADAHVSTEGARWAIRHAAWAIDELSVAEAVLAARTAKAYVSSVGRGVVEAAIQVHGGMGFVWETWAHIYLRRILMCASILGDDTYHYRRIATTRSAA